MLQTEPVGDESIPSSYANSERSGLGENYDADRVAEVRAFLASPHVVHLLKYFIDRGFGTTGWTNMVDVLVIQEKRSGPGHDAPVLRGTKQLQRRLMAPAISAAAAAAAVRGEQIPPARDDQPVHAPAAPHTTSLGNHPGFLGVAKEKQQAHPYCYCFWFPKLALFLSGAFLAFLCLCNGRGGQQEMEAVGPVEWNQEVLHACAVGDCDGVRAAVEGVPPIAACEAVEINTSRTCFHLAATNGHQDIINLLFEGGSACTYLNVEALDRDGHTALHLASLRGCSQCAESLVQGGADLNADDKLGRTSLHLAASAGKTEVMDFLIQAGLQLDTRDSLHRTVAHYAALHGHPKAIKYSLESAAGRGAALDAVDHEGRTSLHLAAAQGRTKTVEYLLQVGLQPNAPDKKKQTALHHAVQGSHLETVIFLVVKASSDINAVDENKRTALHLAVIKGESTVVKALIDVMASSDTNAVDENMQTALHLAARKGDLSSTEHLVEAGCDVDERDKDGKTPLNLAIMNGHVQVVKYLLTKVRFDVNSQDLSGATPFIQAATHGQLDVLKFLASRADGIKAAHDKKGQNALHLATINGHSQVVEYLLTEARLDINSRDSSDTTPFIQAAKSGRLEIAKVLASKAKCNKNARDSHGFTALHWAVQQGNMEMVRYLVDEAHVHVNLETNAAKFPRDLARSYGHDAIDNFLGNKGGWHH